MSLEEKVKDRDTEEETGAMWPQASGHLEPWELGEAGGTLP